VALWLREIARRRSRSISARASSPTLISPLRTLPRCTTRPASGVCTSTISTSAPAVRITPWSASWPPPSA
jgi:hypothetical protein